MAPRKKARADNSDDDFIVTTEESSSEGDYETPNEDVSEESDSPPAKPSPAPRSSSRRQSQRALASPIRQRKEAKLGALEKLKNAREARETRKKSAPARKSKPQSHPSPPRSLSPLSEDSWSEKEKSPPSSGKRARGRADATTVAARLRTKGDAHKPNPLLLGHRDYTERGGRGGGGGDGSYTDDEDLANFIASEGEVHSEDDEDVSVVDSEEEEEKPKKKRAPPPQPKKKKEKLVKISKPPAKKKKQQHSSSEEEEIEAKQVEEDDEFDDEDEQHLASVEKRRLKLLLKPEVVIVSSSSESEEDSEAVLAATTAKAGANGTSGVVNSSQSPSKRKRLRKIAEEEEEKETEPPPSPRTLLELREKSLREALNAVTSLSAEDRKRLEQAMNAVPTAGAIANTTTTRTATGSQEERKKKQDEPVVAKASPTLRERPEKPVLTAAQRIAQAQAAFKAPYHTTAEGQANELLSDDGGDSETPPVTDDEEEGNGDGDLSDADSEGSLRDLIVHDGEEELRAAGLAEGQQTKRTAVWQEAAETLRIGQRDDEDCFYDYVEYLLMCYVDPTYKARINESPEHKAHFQYSVRRIETKMTTARDAVHSEAWRSCSRGLLEAVEWLPGAQSNWDPGYVQEDDERNHKIGHGWDDEEENFHVKCAACNRKNSHATRTIIFKGRPRPPPEDETWEDLPANKKLSEKYLAASPVYKKKRKEAASRALLLGAGARAVATAGGIRQGGGRRGFQLGFRGQEDDDDYNSDDSLSRFINHSRCSSQYLELQQQESPSSSEEDEENGGAPKADLPFDEKRGPTGLYIKREFPVGRQCSARLMLYHGMFHWKHRLLARLIFELKEERRRRKKRNLPIDPGSVSDGVLSREPLKKALWDNFRELTAMGEAHQLAGGEIGNSAWCGGPAANPHRQIVAVLAALHDDSDGEESDIDWGVPGQEENGGEEEIDDDDDDGGAEQPGDRKRKRIAQMYKKQRQKPDGGRAQQADIQKFYGSSPVKEEETQQRTGTIGEGVDANGAGPGPGTQEKRKQMAEGKQYKRLKQKL